MSFQLAVRAWTRRLPRPRSLLATAVLGCAVLGCAMLGWGLPAFAQQSVPDTSQQPSAITEEDLRQQFQGKTFYLRDGYIENALHFNQSGELEGNSPRASFTLSLVEITRVRLEKHRLQLEGVRYGIHFLGALPSEDQAQAVDRVRLTSKKKPLRITIDREVVSASKKRKSAKSRETGTDAGESGSTGSASTISADPSGDRAGTSSTPSLVETHHRLQDALDRVFSAGIDERMIASLPDFWKLYYRALALKSDYRPSDPSVFRQNQVDQKAKLLTAVEAPSNEFAQNNGVAGMSLYHVVVGADGKPGEIAVGRPIGFGLDENAVASLRKASFEPALKGGQPVPVLLDVSVQFRIYSKRTAVSNADEAVPATSLPGPYSVQHP